MMSAAPVLLYTKTGCPYCAAKRAELAARGVAVREINVSEHPEVVSELLKVTRGRRDRAGGRVLVLTDRSEAVNESPPVARRPMHPAARRCSSSP